MLILLSIAWNENIKKGLRIFTLLFWVKNREFKPMFEPNPRTPILALFEAYFSQINSNWDVVCRRVRRLRIEHMFTGKNAHLL